MFAISTFSLSRRSLLCLLATAPLVASLPGCSRSTGLQGSFLQLWQSHNDLTPGQWRQRLAAMAEMGCQSVTLQWVGLIGGDSPWMMPEDTLRTVFDIAHDQGMQVQVGLPYDNASSSPSPWPTPGITWPLPHGRSIELLPAGTSPTSWSSTTGPAPRASNVWRSGWATCRT